MTSDKDLLAAFNLFLGNLTRRLYGGSTPVDEAVRYVLAGGGKQVRPLLCLLSTEAFGAHFACALPGAAALEMIHTYSLVHDDLPCMDNDDFRRGRLTAHRVYGEATALLAGDALLTDAFLVLAESSATESHQETSTRLRLVRELAEAAGGQGMVQGQSLDLAWTGKGGASIETLNAIHAAKTGRLLGAAAAMGAVAAGASAEAVRAFRVFGSEVGLAFQIRDDLLDNNESIGKTRGKDLATGKLTYLSLMHREEAQAAAAASTQRAEEALRSTGVKVEALMNFANRLLQRGY